MKEEKIYSEKIPLKIMEDDNLSVKARWLYIFLSCLRKEGYMRLDNTSIVLQHLSLEEFKETLFELFCRYHVGIFLVDEDFSYELQKKEGTP